MSASFGLLVDILGCEKHHIPLVIHSVCKIYFVSIIRITCKVTFAK